ncbi:hypothetical protein ACFYSH_31380 [Streptomyces sp. NPDC005791]
MHGASDGEAVLVRPDGCPGLGATEAAVPEAAAYPHDLFGA